MDGPWEHYAKLNKLDRERKILYELIDTENRLAVSRSRGSDGQNEWRESKGTNF